MASSESDFQGFIPGVGPLSTTGEWVPVEDDQEVGQVVQSIGQLCRGLRLEQIPLDALGQVEQKGQRVAHSEGQRDQQQHGGGAVLATLLAKGKSNKSTVSPSNNATVL